MSIYNDSKFTQETKPFKKNPFNETFEELSLFPPPGSKFMITEILEDFMEIEAGGSLMITER